MTNHYLSLAFEHTYTRMKNKPLRTSINIMQHHSEFVTFYFVVPDTTTCDFMILVVIMSCVEIVVWDTGRSKIAVDQRAG